MGACLFEASPSPSPGTFAKPRAPGADENRPLKPRELAAQGAGHWAGHLLLQKALRLQCWTARPTLGSGSPKGPEVATGPVPLLAPSRPASPWPGAGIGGWGQGRGPPWECGKSPAQSGCCPVTVLGSSIPAPLGGGVDREGPVEPCLPRSAPQQPGSGTFSAGPQPPPCLSSLRMGDRPGLLAPSGRSPGGWGCVLHAAGRAPGHGQDTPPPAVSGWGQPAQPCCGHIAPCPTSESPSHSGDPSPRALVAADPWGPYQVSSKCPHCLPRSPTGQSLQLTVLVIHPLRTPSPHTGPSLRPAASLEVGPKARAPASPLHTPHPGPQAVGSSLRLQAAGGAQGL